MKWIKVRTRTGDSYVPLNKIIYIKADNKKSTVVFKDLPFLETNHLLKWYQKKLPEPYFFRCHHSYIVNCLNIDSFCWNVIITKGKFRIPVSRQKIIPLKKNMDLLYKD
jgi:DNA-binding LytR/AlgR family response regulator